MPFPESNEPSYLDGLLQAYEGEIAGEAYFETLAGVFTEPDYRQKLMLLAAVEQRTSTALLPLLERHGIKPREHSALVALGHSWVTERAFQHWEGLINNMTTKYPAYVDKFKTLEATGPIEDKSALKILVAHELVLLDFAGHEEAGDTNSLSQVQAFLAEHQFPEFTS